MSTIIDSLVVTLGLDPSGFKKGQTEVKKGLDETRKNADQTAKEMEAAGKRAASFFGSIRTELLALVGVTLSAQGIKTFIVDMTNNLQQLAIGSKSLDMSARSLDGWQRSAEAAGSSAEKITGTLSAFQNTLTKIRTGGAQGDPLFGALASFAGATGANFDYQNDNSETIMRKIAANWSKLSKDAQRRFGSEFGFDNATQQGLANGNLVRDADRFAKISRATDDATRKAQEFNRRLVEMKQNFSAAAQVLYEALIPYVEKLIPMIENLGKWIATHGPEISKFFSDSAVEVNKVVDAVGGWQNALEILLIYFTGKWALGMMGTIGKVGGALTSLGKLGIIGGTLYGANEFADWVDKNSGPKKELSENGMYYKDSWVGQAWGWLKDLVHNDGSNYYDAYGTMPKSSDPRGIRNNNPGNLNFVGQEGASKEGGDNGRFAVFPSMAHGISALYKQLQLYFRRGINTISSIVNKYAPAGDGNDVASYISALVNATGKGANDALDAGDTPTIARLMKGIVDHENGKGYISSSDIMGGIQLGSSASVSGMAGAAGNKTEINIGEMNMQTSSSNVNALGNDIQRHVNRNRLVTPAMSGQG